MERIFYNAILKRINNIWIAKTAAKLLYTVLLLKYQIEKLRLKKTPKSIITEQEAVQVLEKASPRPNISFTEFENKTLAAVDLSVIVPVYNYVSVLKKCIDSIMYQETSYQYEIFLVDDGSTDGSADILKLYEGNSSIHIIRQENRGISAARNAALNQATGRYLMFVDCDDYLEQGAIENLLKRAYEEKCDIVEGAYYTFDDYQNTKREYRQKPILLTENKYDKLMEYTGYPWGKVFKKEMFQGIRFPENCWFEDTLVKMILFRRCNRYSYIETSVYGYRKYEGNFTETQIKSVRGLEHYYMMEWILELSEKNHIGNQDSMQLAMLYHLGEIFRYRIESVEENLQEAAFVAAAGLWNRYKKDKMDKKTVPYMYRELAKAFEIKDFRAWKLACRYM